MLTVTDAASSYDLTTVAAVKSDLGITGSDHDAWIGDAIGYASAIVADAVGRVLAEETVSEVQDHRGQPFALLLARWPVSEVASVTLDGETIEATDYDVDEEAGTLHRLSGGRRVAWQSGRYVIAYTAGYILPGAVTPTLPASLERATIELVKVQWHQRERDPLLRTATVGALTMGWQSRPGDSGIALVDHLIAPHRRPGVW